MPEFYSASQAQHCQRWRGFRLLGMDGSTLRLPAHPELVREFGVHRGANQRGGTGRDYTVARFNVLYDLGVGAELAPQTTGELEMVQRQLKYVNPDDVLIWDRGLLTAPYLISMLPLSHTQRKSFSKPKVSNWTYPPIKLFENFINL